MEFTNLTGEPFTFTNLGSVMHVGAQGVTLSDTNRELLFTAIKEPKLEVVEKDKSLAAIIVGSFDRVIGGSKTPEAEVPPKAAVRFHNDSDHSVDVVACGTRHTVEADSDVYLSGTNDELLAAAMLVTELRVVDKKSIPPSAKATVEKKKEEIKEQKKQAAKTPLAPPLKKVQISKEEAMEQQESLRGAIGGNPNQPHFGEGKEMSDTLASELNKGIKPNEPGHEPAGGLRVV